MRHVKGVLFADYVRTIRGHKEADWGAHLRPEDQAYLGQQISPTDWYPMDSYDRMGGAILHLIARDDLQAVRMWGRLLARPLWETAPELVTAGDPAGTLRRFQGLRANYFDFDALTVGHIADESGEITIGYQMGPITEEGASFQTMGFFEGLLELSGATGIAASFKQCSWVGDASTVLELHWRNPPR